MRVDRLLEMADFIEKMPDVVDMSMYYSCRTPACIAGWIHHRFSDGSCDDTTCKIHDFACSYLNIDYTHSSVLFHPTDWQEPQESANKRAAFALRATATGKQLPKDWWSRPNPYEMKECE